MASTTKPDHLGQQHLTWVSVIIQLHRNSLLRLAFPKHYQPSRQNHRRNNACPTRKAIPVAIPTSKLMSHLPFLKRDLSALHPRHGERPATGRAFAEK